MFSRLLGQLRHIIFGDNGKPPLWKRAYFPYAVFLSGAALLTVGVLFVLVVVPLLMPPPPIDPGYQFFSTGEASSRINPDDDLLLGTRDGRVAVYLPAGAYPFPHTLVIQARRQELIPSRVQGNVERRHAIDLLVVQDGGDILTAVNLAKPMLLCFSPSPDLVATQKEGGIELLVQRYDEDSAPARWVDLPLSPGWQESQVCSAIDHFSLFALTVRWSAAPQPPTPAAKAPDLEPTPDPMEIYRPLDRP